MKAAEFRQTSQKTAPLKVYEKSETTEKRANWVGGGGGGSLRKKKCGGGNCLSKLKRMGEQGGFFTNLILSK